MIFNDSKGNHILFQASLCLCEFESICNMKCKEMESV